MPGAGREAGNERVGWRPGEGGGGRDSCETGGGERHPRGPQATPALRLRAQCRFPPGAPWRGGGIQAWGREGTECPGNMLPRQSRDGANPQTATPVPKGPGGPFKRLPAAAQQQERQRFTTAAPEGGRRSTAPRRRKPGKLREKAFTPAPLHGLGVKPPHN